MPNPNKTQYSLLGIAHNELRSLDDIDPDLRAIGALIDNALEHSNNAAHEIGRYLDRIDTTEGDFEALEKTPCYSDRISPQI